MRITARFSANNLSNSIALASEVLQSGHHHPVFDKEAVFTFGIYFHRLDQMRTAKIFQHGNSQAVRLPKEFRFADAEVVVKHFAGGVLLLPRKYDFETLMGIANEFMGEIGRGDDREPQNRDF